MNHSGEDSPGLGVWVVRDDLNSKEKIKEVRKLAQEVGASRLYLQVVGRADALYQSDLLPRSEVLNETSSDFDPLGYALEIFAETGIDISVWINVNFVWGFRGTPSDPRHVIRSHPDWITFDQEGKSMLEYAETDIEELFGVFLDPGLDGVHDFFSAVASEVASRYDVSELHFDYLRYPYRTFGYHPSVLEKFKEWSSIRQSEGAAYDFDAFRRYLLTEEARKLHKASSVHNANTSFAVYNCYERRAFHERLQPWVTWIRNGFPDFAVVMSYEDNVKAVLESVEEIDDYLDGLSRVRIGLGAFKMMERPSVLEEMIARLRSFSPDEITLFSFRSIKESAALRNLLKRMFSG